MKAPNSAFTFKALLRYNAKQAPKHDVKLAHRHKSDKGRAAIIHYANQPVPYVIDCEIFS